MYLGYDYPRYRYPSYAPWCTPAAVAAEVRYIPQPREVPQANEAIYPSALPSTAGTIPVAVVTSITFREVFRKLPQPQIRYPPPTRGSNNADSPMRNVSVTIPIFTTAYRVTHSEHWTPTGSPTP